MAVRSEVNAGKVANASPDKPRFAAAKRIAYAEGADLFGPNLGQPDATNV